MTTRSSVENFNEEKALLSNGRDTVISGEVRKINAIRGVEWILF